MPLRQFSDIHSHCLSAGADTIINVPLHIDPWGDIAHFSYGIHPWDTADADIDAMLSRVEALAADPRVVAIGETGLDALRGAPLDVQERIFLRHAAIAERVGKPLIIHAVRTAARLAELCRLQRPAVPWIIHGFRGKPQFARQLLAAGLSLSLGTIHNPETAAIVPPGRLYRETDAQ